MQLIIDNTRTAGNFFDNILNDNMFVSVYNINENEDISDIINIHNTDNILFENNYIDTTYTVNSNKYDYINNKTISNYKTLENEKLYNYLNNMLMLSISQYKQYLDFYNEHRKCLIDEKTKKHNFGTIGGGITIEYKIKNIEDSFIFNKYVRCLKCNEFKELIKEDNINITDDLKKSYELNCKYKSFLDIIEYYRFLEIFNEYKNEVIIINFMNTGIGNFITVKTNEYIYDITNIDKF